jgi:hypothetical protein
MSVSRMRAFISSKRVVRRSSRGANAASVNEFSASK